ncbi:hypothetical protein EDD86DRAFT_272046 [Gorgonomyces haynaldii]|nr:hypothetical protein EDD86DRAFT_272046 [Gorgonomyces haynaldii]
MFLRRLTKVRSYSKAPFDPLQKVGVELWEESLGAKIEPKDPKMFEHPLYTPPTEAVTGFGTKELPKPLVWPEYDQFKKNDVQFPDGGPSTVSARRFDNDEESPIGGYPRIEPQYAVLRNPYTYWDQQGRRNYGEVLYDHDNFTDAWGIGAEQNAKFAFKSMGRVALYLAALTALIALWDPSKHAPWAPREYPHDGLRVALGGDPADASDTVHAAHKYSD